MSPPSEAIEGNRGSGLRRVDVAEDEDVFLLDGRNGSRMRISADAHKLLRLVDSGAGFDNIAALASRGRATPISPRVIEEHYRDLVRRIERIEETSRPSPPGFFLRFRLLSERRVVALCRPLTRAFEPRWAALLVGTIVAFVVGLCLRLPTSDLDPASFWIGYVLLLLSVLIHELGHASACASFGAQPSDIGATLYLIYPALYSDVSSAWSLKRWQRVVVDLGGSYFQLVVGAIYLAAWYVTHWEPLAVAVLMILGNSVFSLNPIMKFDGYWILADALGVTNLGKQPARIVRHAWRRLRGQSNEPLPWSPGLSLVLCGYSALSLAVWGLFLVYLTPRVGGMILALGPELDALLHGTGDLPAFLRSLALATVMAFICLKMLHLMIVAPLVKALRRLKRPAEAAGQETLR